MIKFFENTDPNNNLMIQDICKDSPIYGTSILQKLCCHSGDLERCSHWIALDNNNIHICAICRYQDRYTIAMKPGLSINEELLEELALFFKMQSFKTLEGDIAIIPPLRDLLKHKDYYSCITMEYIGAEAISENIKESGKILPCESTSGLYSLICEGYEYFRENVDRDSFIYNICKEKRHGCIELWNLLLSDGQAVTSGTLSTAPYSNCATIGAISTIPTMQGNGYAKQMVRFLCKRAMMLNKKVFLNCGEESLSKLYQPLGFKESGHWMVLE